MPYIDIVADLLGPLGPPGPPFGAACQRLEKGLKELLAPHVKLDFIQNKWEGWGGGGGDISHVRLQNGRWISFQKQDSSPISFH